MRLSYFIGGDIDEKSTQDFLFFLNECHKNANDATIIDVYLRSPGGDLNSYVAMKHAMENSEIPIHLKGTGLMASAAFLLFYFTDNIFKSMEYTSFGLVHLITTVYDDRELRKRKSYDSVLKHHLDIMNSKVVADLKKHKVLSSSQMKEVVNGDDVMLLFDDMYKLMQKCPFGTFLKDGETVYLENNLK